LEKEKRKKEVNIMRPDEILEDIIEEKNEDEIASMYADIFSEIIMKFIEKGYALEETKEILNDSIDILYKNNG
jgi:hypothetical protein